MSFGQWVALQLFNSNENDGEPIVVEPKKTKSIQSRNHGNYIKELQRK